MNAHEKDKLYAIIVLILCILLLGGFGSYSLITSKAVTGIEIILTGLITIITTIIGYLWGASVKHINNDKEETDTK